MGYLGRDFRTYSHVSGIMTCEAKFISHMVRNDDEVNWGLIFRGHLLESEE